jgi:serine/threonine-protein kinase
MSVVTSLSLALADRYRVERELGQGGMATVYLAEGLKHKRKVALKVLKPAHHERDSAVAHLTGVAFAM